MPGDVVQAFAAEIASRDVRRLETYLSEDVAARFDIAGELVGRTKLLAFWRRLFQTYALFELHILKAIIEDDLVISESLYLLGPPRGVILNVRAINVFAVDQGLITHWSDHADLAEVPQSEKDRWRRLGGALW